MQKENPKSPALELAKKIAAAKLSDLAEARALLRERQSARARYETLKRMYSPDEALSKNSSHLDRQAFAELLFQHLLNDGFFTNNRFEVDLSTDEVLLTCYCKESLITKFLDKVGHGADVWLYDPTTLVVVDIMGFDEKVINLELHGKLSDIASFIKKYGIKFKLRENYRKRLEKIEELVAILKYRYKLLKDCVK